jgi:exosortase
MPSSSSLILGLKTVTIIAAVLGVFHQDFAIIMNNSLNSDLSSYLLAIPFLFAYLIYRKRRMLRTAARLETNDQPKSTRHLPTIAGILLFASAILFYWYGSYTFTPLEHHLLTLPFFAAGLTLILFNTQTLRQLAFPIAFLAFLAPPPIEVLRTIGSTLSVTSSQATHAFINILGIPATLTSESGNPVIQITRPTGEIVPFTVSIACSGIYSLLGFLVFAVFVTYMIRDKPWKKLALFLTGLLLVYALNIIRISTVLIMGYNFGEEMATQLFHLLGGWLIIFAGTLIVLILSEKAFHTKIFAKPKQTCPECTSKTIAARTFCQNCGTILQPSPIKLHKSDIAKIAAIAVSLVLLTSIQAPVFALTQGPAVVIVDTPSGQQVTTSILPTISGHDLSFVRREREFEAIAGQDMALIYSYTPTDTLQKTVFATVEIASSRQNLYNWELCLKTGQVYPFGHEEVSQIELKDIQIVQNPPLIARYFAFRYTSTGTLQAILYWFESATFDVNSTPEQKQVKISLIAYPETQEELPLLETQLVTFATSVALYWQPIKAWSPAALFLSQQSPILATATSTSLCIIITLYMFEAIRQRKANAKAYLKLSKPNQQIINAVSETEKSTAATLQAVATIYRNSTGETAGTEEILQKLIEIEKTGIIRSSVANVQDQPTQTWKSQMKLF